MGVTGMGICKIDARNRITLPKDVLNRLNVTSGDIVSIENNNGNICILKAYISVRRNNCKIDDGDAHGDTSHT